MTLSIEVSEHDLYHRYLTLQRRYPNTWLLLFQRSYGGLTTNQTRHVKFCWRPIAGIAETIIPPSSLFELPSRPSAAGKLYSVCDNPIRSRYADLAYHCEHPFCSVCHLSATCSGFVNPRRTTRARVLSTQIWRCLLHFSPAPNGLSSN